MKYQSYDKKKCLARQQNVLMFSLLTLFKGSLLKMFASVKKKVLFPKFCLTFGRDSLILCLVK